MRTPSKPLRFGKLLRKPEVRRVRDMREVILDQRWAEENLGVELYYMYRDLWLEGDRDRILANDLRYDITLIPPRRLGREFVKTKGHYHPECAPGLSFPELYEVLGGRAHLLLQKPGKRGIADVVLVEAGPRDKVLIPPNYGHVTVNPGPKELRMANWVSRRFTSIYEDYVKKRGAAYFELTDGTFLANPAYGELPSLRRLRPAELPELGIERGKPIYELIREPEKLEFLNRPDGYAWVFERVLGATSARAGRGAPGQT
jgi:glucose-6-phosphate isomerase